MRVQVGSKPTVLGIYKICIALMPCPPCREVLVWGRRGVIAAMVKKPALAGWEAALAATLF